MKQRTKKRPSDPLFYKQLMTLVLPIALQNFMSAAVSASDAIMLGFIDQTYLSAVSLAGQVQFVFSLFLAALSIGATILAAQYWGKGNQDAVEQILAFVLEISFVISVLFFAAVTFFPGQLMRIFTADEVLIRQGSLYLRLVGASYLFTGISQICLCIMKNCGKALKSTVIGSSSMVLNIVFNAVLIFGAAGIPAMGIAGAAIATVLARLIEMVWAVFQFGRRAPVRFRVSCFMKPDRLLLKDFMMYTSPVLCNELIWGCGFTMYSVIMGHLGNDAVAANSIANIVKNLIACVCLGIASGGGIVVGNELGRGELARARDYGSRLCHLALVSGAVSGLLLLCISPMILAYAQLSPIAHGYLKGMLIMCSYYLIGKSLNSAVIAGIFCAGGDSRFGLKCDAVVMWLITVPLGLSAAFWLKLPVLAVYFIISLDELAKLPAVYRHYIKYGWVRDLTRE